MTATVDGGRRPLVLWSREDGAVIGGLVAQAFMGWLAVDGFRVVAGHRGRRHRTGLMARAEAEAQVRGATDSVLDTFSFQAPDFCRKLGYREFARLDRFPTGHCRHSMTKSP